MGRRESHRWEGEEQGALFPSKWDGVLMVVRDNTSWCLHSAVIGPVHVGACMHH